MHTYIAHQLTVDLQGAHFIILIANPRSPTESSESELKALVLGELCELILWSAGSWGPMIKDQVLCCRVFTQGGRQTSSLDELECAPVPYQPLANVYR